MPKYRVYRFYVGCHVFNVDADTPVIAAVKARNGQAEFLHEANDPAENAFFNEVYLEDEGEDGDEPVLTLGQKSAEFWRNFNDPEVL